MPVNRNKKTTGSKGEDIAAGYLAKNRYKIIERNFTSKTGEIDIIAKDKKTLCFIEVKTRRSESFGPPYESVTRRKIRKITKVAMGYISQNKIKNVDMRFDVLSVVLDDQRNEYDIELFKGAFDADSSM